MMDPHAVDEDRYRWGRTAPIVDWTSPADPVVQAGLKLACGMNHCGAKPGEWCKHFDGGPLPGGRLVHHFRLDKSMKTDKES